MSKIKIFALGGLNENGKNMYVVDVDHNLFVFDAGLKYADDRMLGIDYIIPNFDYLKEHQKEIKGIFITHAHDENMGALPDMLKELPNVEVYGTAFTIAVIQNELEEESMKTDHLHPIRPHRKINFGANAIFPISLSHSVPEAVGYVLYTPDGAIFYTGDFVFDPTMIGPYKTDIGKLAYVGKQGVLCLMSSSLYAEKKGYTSPNHRTASMIRDTLYKNEKKRILFNIMQAHLYRIQELFSEVMKTDRKIVIMGKRLETVIKSAIDKGYIQFDKTRLLNIHHVNEENLIVLISDEREKPYSNMLRIVKGYDKFIHIKDTDTVLFASPVYDGLEKSATRIFDAISKMGANLVILSDKKYYDYYASSEDLMLMLDLMQPKYYFPVGGEFRHQVANARAAHKIGISDDSILLKLNGQIATFQDGRLVDSKDKIKADDILIDGKTSGDIGELVLKDRESLGENGIVIVCIIIDKITKKVLSGPLITTKGFVYNKENLDLLKEAEKISLTVVEQNSKPNYVDFNKIKAEIRDKVGKFLYHETECNPMIIIVMQEV